MTANDPKRTLRWRFYTEAELSRFAEIDNETSIV